MEMVQLFKYSLSEGYLGYFLFQTITNKLL